MRRLSVPPAPLPNSFQHVPRQRWLRVKAWGIRTGSNITKSLLRTWKFFDNCEIQVIHLAMGGEFITSGVNILLLLFMAFGLNKHTSLDLVTWVSTELRITFYNAPTRCLAHSYGTCGRPVFCLSQ